MQLARGILWLSAILFAAFGLAYTLAPDFMAAAAEIRLSTSTARVDFAAGYGGLQLGVGAFLAVCARRERWVHIGLLASGLALSGFGLTRAVGIALAAGPVRPVLYGALALELSGIALSFWGARRAAEALDEPTGAANER